MAWSSESARVVRVVAVSPGGLSYQGAGRAGEAVELGERVLADCERVLGPEHPFTVRARTNLSHPYRAAARNAERAEQRAQAETGSVGGRGGG